MVKFVSYSPIYEEMHMLKGSLPALGFESIMDQEARFFQRSPAEFKNFSSELEQDIRKISADVNAITQALLDMHVTDLGEAVEGAMDVAELRRVATVFIKLREIYGAEFARKGGTQAILKELTDYIVAQIGPECLTSPDKRKFKKSDPVDVQLKKAALRSLLDPAPHSTWGNYLHTDEHKWDINGQRISAREILAYFVLAAFDPNMPLESKDEATRATCITAEKNHVIYYLGDIRRAHNRRGDIRAVDHDIDEPSCFPGTIGRMGMHLHSLHTVYHEIVQPHKHFYRKMLAFVIDFFKQKPLDAQIQIMTAINKRIMDENDKQSDLIFYQFMASLLKKSEMNKFGEELHKEFGELDPNQFMLAGLYFIDTTVKMFYRFDLDLHQRLEEATLSGLSEKIKTEVEQDLEKIDLSFQRRELAAFLKPLEQIKRSFKACSEKKMQAPAPLDELFALQSEIESQQKEYVDLMKLKEVLSVGLQKAGITLFKARLKPYLSYFDYSGRREFISEESISKIELMPYWLKKFELAFVEMEGACKFAYLSAMRNLTRCRQAVLFFRFIDDISDKTGDKPNYLQPLNELTERLENIVAKCWRILDGKSSSDFVRSIIEYRQLMTEAHDYFMKLVRSFLESGKIPISLRDEGFFQVVLSDSVLFYATMIYYPSPLRNLFEKLNEFMQEGKCLLKVLPEPLLTLTQPIASPDILPSSSAAAAAAAAAPAASSSEASHGKREKSGIKNLLSGFTKLSLKKSAPAFSLTTDARKKIYADFLEENKAIGQRKYGGSSVEQSLLTANDVRYAQEHILAHARKPNLLSLETLLRPDTIVHIVEKQSDPIQVAFTTFKEGQELTEVCPMTVSTVKSYSEMRFKKISTLNHAADLLTCSFESGIEANGKDYINVFFMELYSAMRDNTPFTKENENLFAAALQIQTMPNLHAIVSALPKHFVPLHPYHALRPHIEQAISQRKSQYAQSGSSKKPLAQWESENQGLWQAQLRACLEETVYVKRPKLTLRS